MTLKVQPRWHGRGRSRDDATVKELWELKERVAVMERRGIRPEDASDDEEEFAKEAKSQGDVDPIRLFKSILTVNSIPRSKMLMYDGSLNAKEFIDWINTLDN